MLNWTTGEGTAKYWVSKLLIDTVDIDQDRAVMTYIDDMSEKQIFGQGFMTKNEHRWVLLVNKRYASMEVMLPDASGGTMLIVNEASGFGPPIEKKLTSSQITLDPFTVAIVHMP